MEFLVCFFHDDRRKHLNTDPDISFLKIDLYEKSQYLS